MKRTPSIAQPMRLAKRFPWLLPTALPTVIPALLATLCASMVGLVSTPVGAQTLREEAALFDKPDGSAQGAKLKAATPLKLLKRQGFWVEVDAGGKTGWLKVSSVSFAGAAGPVPIDTGRLGTGNIVATSAARGLSAKDLLEGAPNYDEATRLESLALDASGVTAFRAQGGVQPVGNIATLTAPRTVAAAAPAGGGNSGGNSAGGAAAPAGNAKKKGEDDW